jgi:hypothetical protein
MHNDKAGSLSLPEENSYKVKASGGSFAVIYSNSTIALKIT